MIFISLVLVVMRLTVITFAYRLSRDVRPQHYSIRVQPNMDEDTFQGEATITLFSDNNKDKITLHSHETLNITKVLINQLPGYVEEEDDDLISVRFQDGNVFQPGEHRIYFKYNGTLKNKFGFLKASYKYKNQTGVLVVNEFEPCFARRAFPCFDEPAFKANFNFRLVTPNDSYIAISNMPEIARYSTSKGVIYEFATSVKMSTYLVSIAITDDYLYFENILEYQNKTIPIRVYTYNASKENNNHAIERAKKAIRYFSEYTGINYPLPKLDLIEYNKDSFGKATETWGLVQFDQGLLSSNLHKYGNWQKNVFMFHEIAHFWFGNIVTNDWWNDLWLQEGLATFMSYKLISKEQNHTAFATTIDLTKIYDDEVKYDTFQIVTYLNSTESTVGIFNGLVYNKFATTIDLTKIYDDEVKYDTFQIVTYLNSTESTVGIFNGLVYNKFATTIDLTKIYDDEVKYDTFQIVTYLNSTESTVGIFNGLVYNKAANLFILLEKIVTEETFQEAIRLYLKTHAFSTATTNDLISAFETEAPSISVRSFLESYLYQTGLPVINIDDSSGNYVVMQMPDNKSRKKWTIPVSYRQGNNSTGLIWLDRDADWVTVEVPEESEWIIFNSVEIPGLYVVNYTENIWKNIFDHFDEIQTSELRRQLENVVVLYSMKQISCSIIFQIIDRVKRNAIGSIVDVIIDVVRDMSCFESEYKVLLDYVNHMFGIKAMNYFNATCNENNTRTLDEADYHVRQCAQWIGSNLINYIKHK